MIKDILLLGNPLLRQKSLSLQFPLSPLDQLNLANLLDTLHAFQAEHGFGRAIAGPQIGWLKRVVCVDINGPRFFINPEIVYYSNEQQDLFDDCFSMPNIMVNIKRSQTITVRYYNQDGLECKETFQDDWAELLQHEIDHLYGILAIDRVKTTHDIWARQEWLNQHKHGTNF